MKAQGLPLNFIILGALALLVLVVAVAFFMSGTTTLTTAMSQQQVKTACDNLCNQANREVQKNFEASAMACNSTSNKCITTGYAHGTTVIDSAEKFIKTQYNIQGVGRRNCEDITACQVTFRDATSCMLEEADVLITAGDTATNTTCI